MVKSFADFCVTMATNSDVQQLGGCDAQSVDTSTFTRSEVAANIQRQELALTKITTETDTSSVLLCIACSDEKCAKSKFCKVHKRGHDIIIKYISNLKSLSDEGPEHPQVKAYEWSMEEDVRCAKMVLDYEEMNPSTGNGHKGAKNKRGKPNMTSIVREMNAEKRESEEETLHKVDFEIFQGQMKVYRNWDFRKCKQIWDEYQQNPKTPRDNCGVVPGFAERLHLPGSLFGTDATRSSTSTSEVHRMATTVKSAAMSESDCARGTQDLGRGFKRHRPLLDANGFHAALPQKSVLRGDNERATMSDVIAAQNAPVSVVQPATPAESVTSTSSEGNSSAVKTAPPNKKQKLNVDRERMALRHKIETAWDKLVVNCRNCMSDASAALQQADVIADQKWMLLSHSRMTLAAVMIGHEYKVDEIVEPRQYTHVLCNFVELANSQMEMAIAGGDEKTVAGLTMTEGASHEAHLLEIQMFQWNNETSKMELSPIEEPDKVLVSLAMASLLGEVDKATTFETMEELENKWEASKAGILQLVHSLKVCAKDLKKLKKKRESTAALAVRQKQEQDRKRLTQKVDRDIASEKALAQIEKKSQLFGLNFEDKIPHRTAEEFDAAVRDGDLDWSGPWTTECKPLLERATKDDNAFSKAMKAWPKNMQTAKTWVDEGSCAALVMSQHGPLVPQDLLKDVVPPEVAVDDDDEFMSAQRIFQFWGSKGLLVSPELLFMGSVKMQFEGNQQVVCCSARNAAVASAYLDQIKDGDVAPEPDALRAMIPDLLEKAKTTTTMMNIKSLLLSMDNNHVQLFKRFGFALYSGVATGASLMYVPPGFVSARKK